LVIGGANSTLTPRFSIPGNPRLPFWPPRRTCARQVGVEARHVGQHADLATLSEICDCAVAAPSDAAPLPQSGCVSCIHT
jgi:hypothetical protein